MKVLSKILFVHQVVEVGGASYCMLNLLKAIDREHFFPIVILPHPGPLSKELEKLNIKTIYYSSLCIYPYNKSLFSFGGLREVLQVYNSLKGFKKIITTIQPDIVYLNNMFLFPYLRVIKQLDIKTIIHIREHWPENQHQYQFKLLKKQINKYADQIIAINQYSASMISAPRDKISVVYDWIDMESRREDISLNKIIQEDTSELKVFLFTGGCQWIKGAYEVLRAFTEQIRDSKARLLVLGISTSSNSDSLKDKIKRGVYKMGYPVYSLKIREIIKKDRRIIAVPAQYNITNILEKCYCNLSFFTIPHANLTLAESIILKLPVLAASTPESLEYSIGGNLAMLYPINNYGEFIKKLMNIELWLPILKNKLENRACEVQKLFDAKRNSQLFNKTLINVSRM